MLNCLHSCSFSLLCLFFFVVHLLRYVMRGRARTRLHSERSSYSRRDSGSRGGSSSYRDQEVMTAAGGKIKASTPGMATDPTRPDLYRYWARPDPTRLFQIQARPDPTCSDPGPTRPDPTFCDRLRSPFYDHSKVGFSCRV